MHAPCCHVQSISDVIAPIYYVYRAVLEAGTIDLNSFEFKVEALDDAKVNYSDLFLYIFVPSELNVICLF